MWILRRLKALGASKNQLIEVLKQQIVSVCEVGVPFWGPMITVNESNMLERCLKTGLRIILQENYRSYDSALKQTNMQTLRQRRVLLMNKFSQKAAKSERFRGWFVEESKDEERTLRTKKPTRLLKPIPCRTQRYARSSLPYMTELLSWHPPLPAPDLKMRWPSRVLFHVWSWILFGIRHGIGSLNIQWIVLCPSWLLWYNLVSITALIARHTTCIIYGSNEIHRQYIFLRLLVYWYL